MRAFVFFTMAAAIGLSAVPRCARAGGANLVFTYGAPFNLRIPAEAGATKGWMADAVLNVPDHLIICDVDVSVDITHSAAFDLRLFIQGPAGRRVTLNEGDPVDGFFTGGDYSGTLFDDEAEVRIQDAKPPFTGRYRPLEPLAAFDGQDAYGLWRLRIYDAYQRDSGALNYLGLTFTVAAPKQAITAPAPGAGGLVFLGLVLLGKGQRALARIGR